MLFKIILFIDFNHNTLLISIPIKHNDSGYEKETKSEQKHESKTHYMIIESELQILYLINTGNIFSNPQPINTSVKRFTTIKTK